MKSNVASKVARENDVLSKYPIEVQEKISVKY